MKKLILNCIFLGSAAFFPVNGKKSSSTPIHPEFAVSHNRFAFQLLGAVMEQDTSATSNIVVSPLGIYCSLGALYTGADHATRDSIAEVLHTAEFGGQNLNSLCRELLQGLSQQDDQSELIMANSLWCNRKRCSPKTAFENMCESYYYTPVRSVNFNGRGTSAQISQWADQNTRHRIAVNIPPSSPKDHIYLVNAMGFKCDWQMPFDVNNTRADSFYLPGGGTSMAFYMKKELVARTYSDTSFTMIDLPFGNGKAFSLFLILPDDETQYLENFMASFTETRLYDAISRMNDQWVDLSLPRWECSYSPEEMSPALRKMGMGILFNDYGNADLSNLSASDGSLRAVKRACLSRAYFKSSLTINENGAQAGAAVATPHTAGLAVRPHRSLTVRADHPFLYALISKQQQAILFSGVVKNPGLGASELNESLPKRPVSPRLPHGKRHRR